MAKDVSIKKLIHYWPLYAFVLPSFLLVATFAYFPAISAMYHAFYRWNGDYVSLFIGWTNFGRALGTPAYWLAALAVLVPAVLYSNRVGKAAAVIKIVAGVAAPVVSLAVLFRVGDVLAASARPGLMPILGWAAFLAFGVFFVIRNSENRFAHIALIVTLFAAQILKALGIGSMAAWTIALLLLGLSVWTVPGFRQRPGIHGLRTTQSLAAMGTVLWALAVHAGGDRMLWGGFGVVVVLVAANVFRMIPSILTAVVIHRLKSDRANYWYRVLFVVPMIIPGMVYLLIWKFFFEADSVFNTILHKTGLMALLIRMDGWFDWGGVFEAGSNPVWLNDTHLVLPALIIWGFPWVGVVGVLIYLAGLQGIGESVYEAADLDGVTAFQKFLHIELPLIMTQVRINLVLMIIHTFQMYAFILILFGIEGGPNGKLLVPDLYMFRSAFVEGYAGYACAIGIILFVFILMLTELNNRFVRVDK